MVLASVLKGYAQKTRYVELNSIHALSVPENPDYRFQWEISYGLNGALNVPSTSNVTQNIVWSNRTTYHVTVYPILDSVSCYGESVTLDVIVVDYLSLHTFDDIYFTNRNEAVSGNVGDNDFDETGANIYYNPTPVSMPSNGSLEMFPDGSFTYTPNPGFIGTDEFVYDAYNDNQIPMYSNAKATIVVQDNTTQADLHIEKTGPAKALFGERITYTLSVRNDGPAVATNVTLRDTLAFGLFNPEYTMGGQPAAWKKQLSLGNINPGDSVIVYVLADISKFSPDRLYNQALTYSDVFDPENTDNESIWMTEVKAIYVDLPNQIFVPSCDTVILPGNKSNGNNAIASYQWIPATGLSSESVANPVFTPDTATIGKTSMYVLRITDVEGNIASDTTYLVVPEVPMAIITGDTLFKDLGENIEVYGNESIGEDLDYLWWTDNGNIASVNLLADSIEIDTTGVYYLQISDALGCVSVDSAVVLLESHPPIAVNDSVAIQAASDSTINVLANDTDINYFALEVTGIQTEPNHSTYSWDSQGNFNIRPDSLFWGVDSIEYIVCNKGYPVKCSTAWIIIDALRPPLNADVVLEKTGDDIAFWGDTIHYQLRVYSNGPDTATVTTIEDNLVAGLITPEYSLDGGGTWRTWSKNFIYSDSIRPGEDEVIINIRARILPTAERFLTNKAWINTEIIENNLSNDTSTIVTKIKEKVIAIAGEDIIAGSCYDSVQLDASASQGENLTYSWFPSTYLDNSSSPVPVFLVSPSNIGKTTTYTLTVTDDDGITSTDQINITVLEPPVANAGTDKFLRIGGTVLLDGSQSTVANNIGIYRWSTTNGRIVGDDASKRAAADTIGVYQINVTDEAGCGASDKMEVFWFYYYPFAIPDYYSTNLGTQVSGNVLDNDYEPNHMFTLSVEPGTYKSTNGGNIVMNSDGSFIYTPPSGFSNNVDNFTYTVCNSAVPARCSRGYVEITVNSRARIANLTITKDAIFSEALTEYKDGVQFLLTITNKGDDVASGVMVIDSLTQYLKNARYTYNGSSGNWTGMLSIGTLNPGDVASIKILATATSDAPDIIFNAATVASRTFDDQFDWNDVENRNVDTCSVHIKSDLLAVANLVELYDNNPNDQTLGSCDDNSYLTGINSKSILPIEFYEWSPRDLLTHPDSIRTTFKHVVSDTTVVFTLRVVVGERTATSFVSVHFSKEVIADAGPDRKLNPGEPLVIDASNSQGDGATYKWFINGSVPFTNFENGDPLHPYITEPGAYTLLVTDMHNCSELDTVIVRENELFVVNDFIVLLVNDTLIANVRTNDYDPNNDNLVYSGDVIKDPSHGQLLVNPSTWTGLKSANFLSDRIASDGTFVYVPDLNYTGYDLFTYSVCDDNDPALCVEGRVYIKVIDVDEINSPPVANADYLFADKSDTVSTNILSNDYDFDGGTVTLNTNLIVQPGKGTVTMLPDGSLTYVAYPGSSGTDEFVYQICDNGKPSKCDTARVTVFIHKILGENHRPVAVDDAYYVVEKQIRGNVRANDYDPDGDEIEVLIDSISGPYFGTWDLDRSGEFTYTPKPGFEGTDQIVYEVLETRTSEQYKARATIYITSLDEKRYTTDVSIVKTAPTEILSGSTIRYDIKTTIEGPSLANDVLVSDTLFSQLTNYQFSLDGGVSWRTWNLQNKMEQLMLYADSSLAIRAKIPDRFDGQLYNTARVTHDMNEANPINNSSLATTRVYQRVIADAGADVTVGSCVTEFELDGTASVGMSKLNYEWYPSELLDNPNSAKPTFLTEPGTTRRFMLVVTSSVSTFSDIDTTYVNVEVAPEPISRAGEDIWPITNDPVMLDGGRSTGVGPLLYQWWKYDAQDNVEVIATTDTFTVNRSGDYYLTITDIYGCQSTDLMHVGYAIDEYIAVDDTVYTIQQQSVDFYILRNDFIDEDDRYILSDLTILNGPYHGKIDSTFFGTDTILTYIPDPYYHGPDTFMYIMNTELSPDDDALVFIYVDERRPVMPEAFSPNGDGINDQLIIGNIELYELNSIVIFNRWGNIVYQRDKYDNSEAWNGVANKGIRIGSGALPTGVYFYILDLGPDERITQRIIKGNLYIASDN